VIIFKGKGVQRLRKVKARLKYFGILRKGLKNVHIDNGIGDLWKKGEWLFLLLPYFYIFHYLGYPGGLV